MEEKVRKGELVYRDNENYLRKRELKDECPICILKCKLQFLQRINVVNE
jgi:hypothetical protein